MLGAMLIFWAISGCDPAASSTPPTNTTRAIRELPRIEPPVGCEGKGDTSELQLDIDVDENVRLCLFEDHAVANRADDHPLDRALSSSPSPFPLPQAVVHDLGSPNPFDPHDVVASLNQYRTSHRHGSVASDRVMLVLDLALGLGGRGAHAQQRHQGKAGAQRLASDAHTISSRSEWKTSLAWFGQEACGAAGAA